MAGFSLSRKTFWHYSHSLSIFLAVILYTAGFLCTLLWMNGIVQTPTSAGEPLTQSFTSISPAVSTFSLTYKIAIFGTAWNAIIFVTLLALEGDALPIPTTRLRYEIEKSACIVAITGNAIYSVACLALMSTLARLASDASTRPFVREGQDGPTDNAKEVAKSGSDRQAGQGVTAAIAGLAAFVAVFVCFMDYFHAQNSRHRRIVKEGLQSPEAVAGKQA